ncbi:ScyD/ScyE family protein [Streptomyces sp. MAR4 CNX-425]|uniref:ScyD/ScyE family protein n=1 Tax=Streptomyces sp. MAR4 CNX-425 TaxID=3406343 RepID=UPI003B50635E
MRRLNKSRLAGAAAAVLALTGAGVGAPGPAAAEAAGDTGGAGTLTADSPVTVVANELHEPRSLTWGPGGRLLVAEAGTPGGACDGPDLDSLVCHGLRGSVADVTSGKPDRIVTGLPTHFNTGESVGPNGVKYLDGRLYVLSPGSPQGVPDWLSDNLERKLTREYGALLDITRGRSVVKSNPGRANYGWMRENHPEYFEGPGFDANVYDMTPKPGGGLYVIDSASNTLSSIDRRGNVEVLDFMPYTPAGTDAVPTCIDTGPDGALYIGQLTGYGNSATAANVYRYDPAVGDWEVWESGFSTITGCGFGVNGDFYVTEFATTGLPWTGDPKGDVVQIAKDGTRTRLAEGELLAPHGFLAGPDGSVYVANNSQMWPRGQATDGQVVKIG